MYYVDAGHVIVLGAGCTKKAKAPRLCVCADRSLLDFTGSHRNDKSVAPEYKYQMMKLISFCQFVNAHPLVSK